MTTISSTLNRQLSQVETKEEEKKNILNVQSNEPSSDDEGVIMISDSDLPSKFKNMVWSHTHVCEYDMISCLNRTLNYFEKEGYKWIHINLRKEKSRRFLSGLLTDPDIHKYKLCIISNHLEQKFVEDVKSFVKIDIPAFSLKDLKKIKSLNLSQLFKIVSEHVKISKPESYIKLALKCLKKE